MQLIKDVEIAYFRSFYKETVRRCCDMTVIFGKNDVGKSNIVRALNLFFNNETDYGAEIDFGVDFADSRKAESQNSEDIRKFIYVKITFRTPSNFHKSLGEEFYVKRQWTVSRGSEYVEEFSNHIKSNQRHIARRFLNQIKFIYIPAIKDRAIFQNLLRDVYWCVANDEKFESSILRFAEDVRRGTEDMFEELKDIIGTTTRTSAPNRLEELFETLDFETSKDTSEYSKSLTLQRGDGVKVRHIPELLKFISKNDDKIYHIWGFEEPENSLDFASSTAEANRFLEISKLDDIQIFLTTHNPAFYNISKTENVSQIYVREEGNRSKLIQGKALMSETALSLMHEGFYLPIIADKLKETQDRYEDSLRQLDEVKKERSDLIEAIKATQKPIVLVEGMTDKIILEGVFSKLNLPLTFEIVAAGGVNQLDLFAKKKEFLSDVIGERLVLVVVDCDKAGCGALPADIKYNEVFKLSSSGYHWRTLPLRGEHQSILEGIDCERPIFCIEDLFGLEHLKKANAEGILAFKPTFRSGIRTNNINLLNAVSGDEDLKLQLLEINDSSKVGFANWLIEQDLDASAVDLIKGLYDDIVSVAA